VRSDGSGPVAGGGAEGPAAGSRIVKVVPTPALEATEIVPRIARTNEDTMARPSPAPRPLRWVAWLPR
jgi:hypothetical protein